MKRSVSGPPPAAPNRPSAPLKGGKRRQAELAIAALLAGRTIRQASEECSIGYRTLKDWLASSWFQDEYQAAKSDVLGSTINHLRSISSDSVVCLHQVLTNTANPPSSRVSAARAVLELLMRATELQDITDRIARLENLSRGEDVP